MPTTASTVGTSLMIHQMANLPNKAPFPPRAVSLPQQRILTFQKMSLSTLSCSPDKNISRPISSRWTPSPNITFPFSPSSCLRLPTTPPVALIKLHTLVLTERWAFSMEPRFYAPFQTTCGTISDHTIIRSVKKALKHI